MNNIIVGIDEAGRGPLAGRVYAAAVILETSNSIKGLNDSKKLSALQREALYEEIINKSLAYSISYASNEEIDQINILKASHLAMKRALTGIETYFDSVLVDGNIYPFEESHKGMAIIKGDSKVPQIMAASILAKVSRDKYMEQMSKLYPQYDFYKHKGYPTLHHRNLVKIYGPSPIHRKTFKGVKEYLIAKEN